MKLNQAGKIFIPGAFAAIALVVWQLMGTGPGPDLPADYPDILLLQGVPSGNEDWSFAPFSDQGAWFGFAIPEKNRPDLRGGFSGPFLMPEGRWLGPQLAALELWKAESGARISWEVAENHRAKVFPGSLRREMLLTGLRVRQSLWFDAAGTAILWTRFENTGDTVQNLETAWAGSVFAGATLEKTGTGILARSSGGASFKVEADRKVSELEIDGDHYRIRLAEVTSIEPGKSASVALSLTFALSGDPVPEKSLALEQPEVSWSRHLDRWNQYLGSVDTGGPKEDPLQVLAVKSLMTLVNNWRGPAGRMDYSALFPSSNVWYFNGFWAWDSWKHAVGVLQFDDELAKDQVRAMFAHQNDRGMIPDVVYQDAGEDNWRDTKPPLAGWAIGSIFEKTGDLEFVRELYPRLVAYHRFWYAERDHDGDGLCEYGSTDGTIVAARWESGMDNAVRFDDTEMLANGPGAWSMNQESVDLNAYLFREKEALAILAGALGKKSEADQWTDEAVSLKKKIRNEMFDEKTGWFYDIGIESGSIVPVQGPEGWIPLWAGVASDEQAARVRDTMMDPDKFNTHVPFPTVAADHQEFSDGYWRGSVWLDQAYFGVEGLKNYGFASEARSMAGKLFKNLEGATVAGRPLRENYHPLTGAGQNVKHFSWTAAHLLLLASSADFPQEKRVN